MAELNQVLKEPAAGSVLLFDCWTPASERGRGHYGLCASLVALRMFEARRRPWIFSAATNVSSLRGLEHAGFVRRFSLVRKKRLLLNRISAVEFKSQGAQMPDLYPSA